MRARVMSYEYVIDSYAWVEYFRASPAGEVAKEFIERKKSATPTIVVSEMSRKLLKEIDEGNETEEGRLKRLQFIRATTQVVDLDFAIAVQAGEIDSSMKKHRKGWGLADSIILCTAKVAKGRVVTGDEHFKGLDETVFIREQQSASR
jgi:predicted nucleic acid-binding protein